MLKKSIKLKKSSKLALDREVLRNLKHLSPEDLGQVQGATGDPDVCSFCGENSCVPH